MKVEKDYTIRTWGIILTFIGIIIYIIALSNVYTIGANAAFVFCILGMIPNIAGLLLWIFGGIQKIEIYDDRIVLRSPNVSRTDGSGIYNYTLKYSDIKSCNSCHDNGKSITIYDYNGRYFVVKNIKNSYEVSTYINQKINENKPVEKVEIKSRESESSNESLSKLLMSLKGLLDAGVITQEEFEQKKKELLEKM